MENKFHGIKIKVNSQSENETVQKILFSQGCEWSGRGGRHLQYVDAPYLFVNQYGLITYSRSEITFKEHGNKEMEICMEPSLKEVSMTEIFGKKINVRLLEEFLDKYGK